MSGEMRDSFSPIEMKSCPASEKRSSFTELDRMEVGPAKAPLVTHATSGSLNLPIWGHVEMRHLALLALVVQTVGSILMLRISRTHELKPGEVRYLNTTAVFMAEVVKLLMSTMLVASECAWNLSITFGLIRTEIFGKPFETLKVGVPALLYTLQNNLIFIALSNMSGAMYQITYQLKIMTTAVLSVIILNKKLGCSKWVALSLLTLGVGLIQLQEAKPPKSPAESLGKPVVGVVAVLLACLTSGFAGVYFEKILKESKTSIWLRNIQLAMYGCVLALAGALWNDQAAIFKRGFFQGYNSYTVSAILLQSAGGLIVAAVLKYADNILKCFGNSVAIVISCVLSYYLVGDFIPNMLFAVGTVFVIWATYQYSAEINWKRLFVLEQV